MFYGFDWSYDTIAIGQTGSLLFLALSIKPTHWFSMRTSFPFVFFYFVFILHQLPPLGLVLGKQPPKVLKVG
jgi:hypothetical protein